MREKSANSEYFLVLNFPYLDGILRFTFTISVSITRKNYIPEKSLNSDTFSLVNRVEISKSFKPDA